MPIHKMIFFFKEKNQSSNHNGINGLTQVNIPLIKEWDGMV